jgi:hypothetical protein
MNGEISRTPAYRSLYVVVDPMLAVLRKLAPGLVTTTVEVGRAMLAVARHGADRPVIENRDINTIAARG